MLPLEGISGGEGVGPAVTDIIMVVGNILIIVFPVEEVIYSKLESEVLIELVIGGKVHEEISIPGAEVTTVVIIFLRISRSNIQIPIRNKHTVQINSPGCLIVSCSQMKQMAGHVIVLISIILGSLPCVINIRCPYITVTLG